MPFTAGSGLKDLIEQARRERTDTRAQMLRLLVREFIRNPIRSEAADARFVTLVMRLLETVDTSVAARAVRELAPHPDVPRELVLELATGPLSLAGPILRLSPVLDDNDLATLAQEAAPAHLAAIAARRDVSPALARRIAELVHQGHGETAGVSYTATDLAHTDIVDADIPPEAMVRADVQEQVETPVAAPSETAQLATSPSPVSPSAQMEFFDASPEERTTLLARLVTLPPLPLAERPASASPTDIDALLAAAKTVQAERVAGLLEKLLAVSEASAGRIVADASGQSFVVAARALGISFAILSRILFRLHPATGRSADEMSRLSDIFEALPVSSAQHLVATWRTGRRVVRERGEDTPSMRHYAQPHAAAKAMADNAAGRARGS